MIQLDLDHLKQPMKPLKQMYNNLNIYPLHHPAIRTLAKKKKKKKKPLAFVAFTYQRSIGNGQVFSHKHH